MLNIVIFGAPGSGKGTQSELIIKEYGVGVWRRSYLDWRRFACRDEG